MKAIVLSSQTGWQGIKDNYLVYPGLMRTLVDYRQQVIDALLDEVLHSHNAFAHLEAIRSDDSGLLLQPVLGIIAAGSQRLTSDYDANFFAHSGNQWQEIAAVEEFNEKFRQDWQRRESGFVFDTNIYTAGHIRAAAFSKDSDKLRLVRQVRGLLKATDNPPTSEQRQAVNDLVSEINSIPENTIQRGLEPLEVGNFDPFSEQAQDLEERLKKVVVQEYQQSRWQYGVGADFDEVAVVMGLVHLREYWHGISVEETPDGSTAIPQSGWDYLCQGLTHAQIPADLRQINQQRLEVAQTLHDRLCDERKAERQRLQWRYPDESETSINFKADNSLYVKYLKEVELKLNQQQGADPSAQPPLQRDLQKLQSIALFFANEAYITAAALEQVLLTQQMRLDMPLSTQQYQVASLEHTAYIGEQITHSGGNMDEALWRSAKYLDRFLETVKKSERLSGGQIPLAPLRAQMDALHPVVRELLTIKKDEGLLTDDQKTQAAEPIRQNYADQVGAALPELARQCLDRQIDLYLQIQAYREQQHQWAGTILPIAWKLFDTVQTVHPERLESLGDDQLAYSGQHYQLVLDSRLGRFSLCDQEGDREELISYSLAQEELVSVDSLTLDDVSRWIRIHHQLSRQAELDQDR